MIKTSIFICQLSFEVQNKIKKMVIEYLKENDCYTLENLNNIMNDRLVNLQDVTFMKQYNDIINYIKQLK